MSSETGMRVWSNREKYSDPNFAMFNSHLLTSIRAMGQTKISYGKSL